MKKFGVAIISIMVLVASALFVGCEDGSTKKEISTIEVQGLRDAYYLTETINFLDANLSITYSDGSTETLTNGEIDLENVDARNENTQFILYTSGLSSADPMQEGSYPISCLIIGEEEQRPLMTIEINDDMSLVYELAYFADPQFVDDYKENRDLALASGSVIDAEGYDKNAFMLATDYTVGDDNEFIYKPDYTLYKLGTIEEVVANINVEVEVKEGNDIVGSNIYTFNNDTYGFKFTDEAVGHTYTITMRPTDWDLEDLQMNESTFTITVADGYNVYDALDLGRINLLDDSNLENLDKVAYKTSVRNIFYNTETKTYQNLKYYELWEDFLTEKGETNLNEINGVYLHNNIAVTAQDIPAEYFISSLETPNEKAIGTLRDFAFLYNHFMFDTFTINGNLFALNFSNIKAGMSNAILGSNSTDSYLQIYNSENDFTEAGHSAVFAFVGYEGAPTATVCNVDARGNMSTAYSSNVGEGEDEMDAVGAAGSLIFVKSIHSITEVDNVIAKEFLIALFMEGEWGNKTMDISNTKVFDCFNSGLFIYASLDNTVTNSHFERFGGPVMFLISIERDNDEHHDTGIKIDEDSKLVSMVEGNEGWFVLNKADLIANALKGDLTDLLNLYNATILHENNTKFNLVSVIMDNDYLVSTSPTIYGKYQYGNHAEFDTSNPELTKYLTEFTPVAFLTDDGHTLSMQSAELPVVGATPLFALDGTIVLPESLSALAPSYDTYNLSTSGDYINMLYRAGSATIGAVLGLAEYTATATE